MPTGLFWTDHLGRTYPVPTTKNKLNYSKNPYHAALRVYVFFRDGFTCQDCGTAAINPESYDGKYGLQSQSGRLLLLDHTVSIRMGGTNAPDNLRCLCDPCNARKSVFVEGAGGCRA